MIDLRNGTCFSSVRPDLHPLHPRVKHASLFPPILASLFGPVHAAHPSPTGQRHDDARAIILRAEILPEVNDGLCRSRWIRRIASQVDDFLVGHERCQAVCDQNNVGVIVS